VNVEKEIRGHFRVKKRDTIPYKGWKNSTRADLYKLFNKLGYRNGAEIGVNMGRNARKMYSLIPDLKLTLIDPWSAFGGNTDERMEKIYQNCKSRLSRWNPIYIRKPSIEAAKDFQDESFDFVYIDGLHNFDACIIDIIHWAPKVKIGGIVSGHDFYYGYSPHTGVIEAVRAYTYAHNIKEWHVTGQNRPWRGTDFEPPSFFWAKT